MARSWLDRDPPKNPSLAEAYWCEMNYFLQHTSTGGHPDCQCPEDMGHNDPRWEQWHAEIVAETEK
jgi:hypothetical protein